MSKVYDLVKNDLGISKGNPEEKALRMARFTALIAEKLEIQNVQELSDASLVAQTVLPEHMDMYQGKEGIAFDRTINANRGENSLTAVKDKVQLTDFQKDAILGKNDASKIIKLAESIIAIQYNRQKTVDGKEITVAGVTDIQEILKQLWPDQRAMLSEKDFEEVIDIEQQEYVRAEEVRKKADGVIWNVHKKSLIDNCIIINMDELPNLEEEKVSFWYELLQNLTVEDREEILIKLRTIKDIMEFSNLVQSFKTKSAIHVATKEITPEAVKEVLATVAPDKSKTNPGE